MSCGHGRLSNAGARSHVDVTPIPGVQVHERVETHGEAFSAPAWTAITRGSSQSPLNGRVELFPRRAGAAYRTPPAERQRVITAGGRSIAPFHSERARSQSASPKVRPDRPRPRVRPGRCCRGGRTSPHRGSEYRYGVVGPSVSFAPVQRVHTHAGLA